jgi:HNH endonuclease
MTDKQWKILEFTKHPNLKVSSNGEVINAKTGHTLKQHLSGSYYAVCISTSNKGIGSVFNYYVHRLVAKAFLVENTRPNVTVDHINRISTDNRLENLRWATKEEQQKNRAQPTEKVPIPVVQKTLEGKYVKLWSSSLEVATYYGVGKDSIEKAIRGKTKSSCGYKWEYKDKIIKGEVWKQVHTKIGVVFVSSIGRAATNLKKHPTYGSLSAHGYMRFKYTITNNKGRELVHRLVAKAFIPNPNNLPIINHKNGNKVDNRVDNLEWCSQPHNIREAHKLHLIKRTGKPVVRIDLETGERVVYESASEAARQNSIGKFGIGRTCRHEQKTYAGYRWIFD